ncbi:MAG: tRNA lysidine(34) synthetase TilS, partial [Rhodothermales bacterium]|nr:tRNA lysidine(34) synthetase TilS [Rhodothermales bacterium]
MSASLKLDLDALPDGPLLVAVSGGLDSVALAHALTKAERSITIGHVHHGIRRESDEEEQLVLGLAADLGVGVRVAHLQLDTARTGSLQEIARNARYAALATMANDLEAVAVVTAHHADDQAETVLI